MFVVCDCLIKFADCCLPNSFFAPYFPHYKEHLNFECLLHLLQHYGYLLVLGMIFFLRKTLHVFLHIQYIFLQFVVCCVFLDAKHREGKLFPDAQW